jgi:hypothetical protein
MINDSIKIIKLSYIRRRSAVPNLGSAVIFLPTVPFSNARKTRFTILYANYLQITVDCATIGLFARLHCFENIISPPSLFDQNFCPLKEKGWVLLTQIFKFKHA